MGVEGDMEEGAVMGVIGVVGAVGQGGGGCSSKDVFVSFAVAEIERADVIISNARCSIDSLSPSFIVR